MSKTYSQNLFRVIQSLNKAEKKHFRLFARRNNSSASSHYTILFNTLLRLKEYDEGAVMKQCRQIPRPQLSNVKNYLYRLVLNSLRNFHRNNITDLRIREIADHAALLYLRGL